MKITELVNEMKKNENLNLEEILEIRAYIPMAEKRAIIEDIVNKASTIGKNDGFWSYDSLTSMIFFEIAMVKYHTGLEASESVEDDYDAIKSYLVDKLDLYTILMPYYKEDYYECLLMLNVAIKDIKYKHSVEASMANLFSIVANNVTNIADILNTKLQNFDINETIFKDIDTTQIKNLLEKYGK